MNLYGRKSIMKIVYQIILAISLALTANHVHANNNCSNSEPMTYEKCTDILDLIANSDFLDTLLAKELCVISDATNTENRDLIRDQRVKCMVSQILYKDVSSLVQAARSCGVKLPEPFF